MAPAVPHLHGCLEVLGVNAQNLSVQHLIQQRCEARTSHNALAFICVPNALAFMHAHNALAFMHVRNALAFICVHNDCYRIAFFCNNLITRQQCCHTANSMHLCSNYVQYVQHSLNECLLRRTRVGISMSCGDNAHFDIFGLKGHRSWGRQCHSAWCWSNTAKSGENRRKPKLLAFSPLVGLAVQQGCSEIACLTTQLDVSGEKLLTKCNA